MFFAIVGSVVLVNVVWWRWAMRRVRHLRGARLLLTLFQLPLLAQILWMFVARDSALRSHEWLPLPLIALSYLWNLLAIPALALPLALGWLWGRLRPPAPPPESRRRFLLSCAAFTPPVLTGVGLAAALPHLQDLRVRRLTLAIPGLPDALDGVTIAHVSDLHVGKFSTDEALDGLVATVNGLHADLVLLTGDLIDLSLADLPRALAVVERFERGGGLFSCEGNHDLIDDARAFERRMQRSDVPLLLDEAATVEVRGAPVQILGARWQRGDAGHAASLARLRALRDPQAFPILLAHHPHAFDQAAGFPLTLAGHTHGGQLMLNERLGAGPVLFRYWSGIYERGAERLVVSNGAGNWFPLRTRAPAEIIHLTLRA